MSLLYIIKSAQRTVYAETKEYSNIVRHYQLTSLICKNELWEYTCRIVYGVHDITYYNVINGCSPVYGTTRRKHSAV